MTRLQLSLGAVIVLSSHRLSIFQNLSLGFLTLSPVSYSTLLKSFWVDKTSLTIFDECKVRLQLSAYSINIWCNVLPMDIAHLLLSSPWIYDKNATNFERMTLISSPIM